jgi:thiopeptide-type bacteriocin biosynthesis protein
MSTHDLIDAVVAAFGAVSAPDKSSWTADERAEASRLRDLFVAAGTARLEERGNQDAWLDVAVSFSSQELVDRFLARRVAHAVDIWRSDGTVRHSFFLRKSPGLRLRFSGKNLGSTLLPRLTDLLDAARSKEEIAGHHFGIYEPETHRFGGEEGIDIAHDLFTHDCEEFYRLLALEHAGTSTSGREILSLFVLNDLIGRLTEDLWEQWDVWKNMRIAGRRPPLDEASIQSLTAQADLNRDAIMGTLYTARNRLLGFDPQERDILSRYCATNERIAARFAEAAKRRALAYGPRRVLPFIIVFHWNIWHFDIRAQVALTFIMDRLLDGGGVDVAR